MVFFATKFSKSTAGLLITPIFFLAANAGPSMNTPEKEISMPKMRTDIPEKDQWNTAALYPSFKEWEAELQTIQGQGEEIHWPELASYKGQLMDASQLTDMLNKLFSLDRELSKLYTYAHLKLDEDVGNDVNKHYFGLISQLLHAFQLESSWIEPELLTLSESQYQKLLNAPSLKPFHFYLEKVSRKKAHTLPPEQEKILALSGKALDAPYKAFGALNNADLKFSPAVDSKGQEHPLSNGSYLMYVRSPDRKLRKTSFTHLHQGYENHANTICELLQGLIESHLFIAKARNFSSCLEAALFPHNIDPKVYSQLIQSVKKGLPVMHEYIKLRKEALHLDQIHAYDLYVPLISETNMNMSYPDACQAVIKSVSLLGTEYQEILRKGLTTDRWVDIYENARKRSGAYSSGCYDSMPYILLNYHGTLNDVFTLAHEAGHSMHSYYSRTHQPYIDSQYPIFVAEVASTFNEQLLLRHLLSLAKTKQEKAALLNYQIEGIRGTIFRQTLFAEFELQLHKWAEEGVPFTPSLLNETYLKLTQEYYGPDFAADPELAFEWARIPHFYYDFYVYQYATGLSASLELFTQATQSQDARTKYLQFLSSGGSKYPLDLLKIAGVNMTSSKPVESALQHFEQLIEELRECLN
jgi:oligoendopeptidase F